MLQVVKMILCALAVIGSVSCRRHMKAADYAAYITSKENGLKKVSQIDGWEFAMQYRPYDYVMLMESKGQVSSLDLEKRKAQMLGTAWFTIAIKRADQMVTPLRYGVSSNEEYNVRLNYYLNEAQKDVKLLYGKDTLRPVSYLFENNYNLTPQETILVGFYLPKGEKYPCKDMRLSYVDNVFKNGIINAEFSEENLKKIPALAY